MIMDDKRIVIGLQRKDEKVFELFYKQYKNLCYYVIFDIVKNEMNAEELLQDSFIDAYTKINTFDGKNFKAWFLKIAKNNALDFYRKKNKIVLDEELLASEKSFDHDDSLITDLRSVLNKDEFLVLMLCSLYDMKQKDIAAYMEKPEGTISWLYKEAKTKAKKFLERSK